MRSENRGGASGVGQKAVGVGSITKGWDRVQSGGPSAWATGDIILCFDGTTPAGECQAHSPRATKRMRELARVNGRFLVCSPSRNPVILSKKQTPARLGIYCIR